MHLDKFLLSCWARLCRANFWSLFQKFVTFARQSFARYVPKPLHNREFVDP